MKMQNRFPFVLHLVADAGGEGVLAMTELVIGSSPS
jgi:hypothetical protein